MQKSSKDQSHLPGEMVNTVTKPLARFLRIETAGGGVLLVATFAALILSNSPWADGFASLWDTQLGFRFESYDYTRGLKAWINDGAMTLFFFLVALELKRELVLGELNKPRVAALSIASAVGGMVVPAALYLLVQWNQPGLAGWGTVMATDTAFVIGCLALIGSRAPHSLRVFMLSLAIVDDIGAILVVAIGYSHQIEWIPLGVAAIGIGVVYLMRRVGIRQFPQYFIAGGLIWIAVDASGIHATITGVILGLMTPARRWVSDNRLYAILDQVVAHPKSHATSGETKDRDTLQEAEVAARETLSPVERLEVALHPWVGFVIMPLFALANAGLALRAEGFDGLLTFAVVLGFVVGKPVGILGFAWIALHSGLAVRPSNLSWRFLTGGAFLAGVGFTMALFIAHLAFAPELLESAKLGIFLASVLSALLGLSLLYFDRSQAK